MSHFLDWSFNQSRPAHFSKSIHQTLVGKALFEFGTQDANIAVLASSSSSFLNSSLGPNILNLFAGDQESVKLFTDLFLCCTSPQSTTLQFAHSLRASCNARANDDARFQEKLKMLLETLFTKTKYFSKSLKTLRLYSPSMSDLSLVLSDELVALENFSISRLTPDTIVADPSSGKQFMADEVMKCIVKIPHLKKLGITKCSDTVNFYPSTFRILASSHLTQTLESLELPQISNSVDGDGLKSLFNSSSSSWNKLKFLNLANCTHLTDENCLALLGAACPNLTELNLRGNNKFTPEGLESLLPSLGDQLQSLNVEYCACGLLTSQGTKVIGKMANLTDLNLGYAISINAAALANLSDLRFLKKLRLTSCLHVDNETMRSIAEASYAPVLEELYLEGCSRITDQGFVHFLPTRTISATKFKLPSLRYLGLESCDRISAEAITYIGLSFPNLTDLVISECNHPSITHLVVKRFLCQSTVLKKLKSVMFTPGEDGCDAKAAQKWFNQFPHINMIMSY